MDAASRVDDSVDGGHDQRSWRALQALTATDPVWAPRVALVVAHPDDETLGAGARLGRLREALFVHITDGAPRDGADALAAGFASPAAYAAARRRELGAALRTAGVNPDGARCFDIPDQQVLPALAQVARRLATLIAQQRIEVILTHSYEGGHPDHDATACAVHAAAALIAREGPKPVVLELTGYHASTGKVTAGAFLPTAKPVPEVVAPLTRQESAAKRAALDQFATQARVIDGLIAGSRLLQEERFRAAPAHDFAAVPHPGRLHHERFPWSIDGATWCARAQDQLARLNLPSSPMRAAP